MHLKKLEAEDEDFKLLEAKQTGANIIKLFFFLIDVPDK